MFSNPRLRTHPRTTSVRLVEFDPSVHGATFAFHAFDFLSNIRPNETYADKIRLVGSWAPSSGKENNPRPVHEEDVFLDRKTMTVK